MPRASPAPRWPRWPCPSGSRSAFTAPGFRTPSEPRGSLQRRPPMRAQVLPNLTHSALRILRQDGPGRLALVVFRLGVSPLLEFGRLVFFARELDEEPTGVEAPAGIELRLATVSDISQLVSAGRPDPALASERFTRGDRCVVAVDQGGTVPHSRWVTSIPTPIPELRMSIRPRPGEAYFYDGY